MKKKTALILILVILFSMLSACKDEEEKDRDESANSQFVQKIYKHSSVITSIYEPSALTLSPLTLNEESNKGEVLSIVYSDTDKTYYASFFKYGYDPEYMQVTNEYRIDIYNGEFEFIRTVEFDGTVYNRYPNSVISIKNGFNIDKNNNIYLLACDFDSRGQIISTGRALLAFDNYGKFIEDIKIDDAENIFDVGNTFFITDNNFIFASFDGIQITDKKGKTTKEITDQGMILSVDTDNINSLYVAYSGGILKKINISDGKEIWSVRDSKGFPMNRVSYSHEDDRLCVYKNEVISLYDTGGNFLGDMCDLRDFKPSYENIDIIYSDIDIKDYDSGMIHSLLYINSENIVFYFTDSSSFLDDSGANVWVNIYDVVQLKALSDEETSKIMEEREEQQKAKKTIKILIPSYDVVLERVIHNYNKISSDTYVELEHFSDQAWVANHYDYIQYVSMRINSGEDDWDIISGAIIPYDVYKAKGYITDIDKLDSEGTLKDSERYYTNVLDALRTRDGGLYSFPNAVYFNVIEALKQPLESELSSWRDILDLKLQLYDNKVMSALVLEDVASEFVSTDYENIFFDKNKFYEFLDMVNELNDPSFYTDDRKNADINIFLLAPIEANIYEPPYSVNISPSTINLSGNMKYMFNHESYLIWSKSPAQKEAFDFLKYMADTSGNLGISRDKFNKQITEYRDNLPITLTQRGLNAEEYAVRTERAIQDISRIYENLNTAFAVINYDLKLLMQEQLVKYLEGEVTKEAFAEKIENFLWLYENEDK